MKTTIHIRLSVIETGCDDKERHHRPLTTIVYTLFRKDDDDDDNDDDGNVKEEVIKEAEGERMPTFCSWLQINDVDEKRPFSPRPFSLSRFPSPYASLILFLITFSLFSVSVSVSGSGSV